MTHKSAQTTGELVQEYVRSKAERASSPERVQEVGQDLGRALRFRIDVLGVDSMQLLNIAPASVLHKLEELEEQADLEDRNMLARATRPADDTAVTKLGEQSWAPRPRKRALHRAPPRR